MRRPLPEPAPGESLCSSTWQVQVSTDRDGYAEPPTRDQSRTRGHVVPGPASALHDDDAVERPTCDGPAVTAVEAHGCPIAPVRCRNLGRQAPLRDAARQLRCRSSLYRCPSAGGRESASDSDRRHDEREGNDDGDDPLHAGQVLCIEGLPVFSVPATDGECDSGTGLVPARRGESAGYHPSLGHDRGLRFVTCPTAQRAFVSARSAAARVLPLSFGTTHRFCFVAAATAKLWVAVGAAA